jgi:hypothetical protein
MGLLETVRSVADVAFEIAGNFKVQVQYVSKQAQTYSPSTGSVTATADRSVTMNVIMTKAKSREVDNVAVLANDVWALALQSSFDDFEPKESDEVVNGTRRYRVISVHKIIESGTVAWKLQLRLRK